MFKHDFKLKNPTISHFGDNGSLCVVDQTVTKEFNVNNFGWPRSTIAQLAAAQTMEQYKLIADQLQQTPAVFNLKPSKDGKVSSYSLDDIERAVNLVKPRYAQLSFEVEQFAKELSRYDTKLIDDAYLKSLEDEKPIEQKSSEAAVTVPA